MNVVQNSIISKNTRNKIESNQKLSQNVNVNEMQRIEYQNNECEKWQFSA